MDLTPTTAATPKKSHANVLLVCAMIFTVGVVIFYNYLMKVNRDALQAGKDEQRPAYKGQLRTNLAAVDMSGKDVNIGQLEGKVWVCAYLYTLCPRGCAGLADRMKILQDEFGSDPRFRLVSMSLNAEVDTPERLREWTAAKGLGGDNWWFLTGDGKSLRGYMRDEFKLPFREIPEKDQLIPGDKFEHKLAIVLVDHKLRLRGTYDFSDPGFYDVYEEQIKKDIKAVLAEAESDEKAGK